MSVRSRVARMPSDLGPAVGKVAEVLLVFMKLQLALHYFRPVHQDFGHHLAHRWLIASSRTCSSVGSLVGVVPRCGAHNTSATRGQSIWHTDAASLWVRVDVGIQAHHTAVLLWYPQ